MALSETVYSPSYPNFSKTVTIDIVRMVPVGGEGDEKYIVKVSTTSYSDNTLRTAINPIYFYDLKRGWAESFIITTPVSLAGGTVTVAIDEADSGAVTVTLASGTYQGSTIASQIQAALRATASGSGVKVSASNKLSYLNAQTEFTDGRLRIISGSVKSSYDDSTNWVNTSSVKVTGGTMANTLGFSTGYPNSFTLSSTASGTLHAPASAVVTLDDAVKFGIMSIVNQLDFTS